MDSFLTMCAWPVLDTCEFADCKGAEEAGSVAEKEECLRTRFLQDHPEALHKFTADLLPLLLQVYGSTVLEKVRLWGVCAATCCTMCQVMVL